MRNKQTRSSGDPRRRLMTSSTVTVGAELVQQGGRGLSQAPQGRGGGIAKGFYIIYIYCIYFCIYSIKHNIILEFSAS